MRSFFAPGLFLRQSSPSFSASLSTFSSFVVIFRRVFAREEPTAETLFGAVCIYLIIGFSFARLYAIIAIIQPHAFYLDPAIYPRGVPEVFDFIFIALEA